MAEASSGVIGRGWLASALPLCQVHDVALCDLDGVVYVGRAAVPHAADALALARSAGMRAGFVTNNASRPPAKVAAHLVALGIPAVEADVVTSAQAAVRVLAEMLPHGAKVLYVGGEGVPVALRERGFVPVRSIVDQPVALIQGYGRDVGWEQLAQGSYAIFSGLPWVATNGDRTIPTPLGKALGNGSMVAALSFATGATPVVAGKPEPPLMLESVERLAARNPLVVGDRLDTDIEGASRSGIASLLVLTGVTGWRELLTAPPLLRPSYLANDMRGILEAHPEVVITRSDDRLTSSCRTATGSCRIETASPSSEPIDQWVGLSALDPGSVHGLDAVRALAGLAWAAADLGLSATDLELSLVGEGRVGTTAE